jgi:hypothetical protein
MAPPPKSPHLFLPEDRGYRTRCHIWQRAKSSAGYGVLRVPGTRRVALAHRYFYELTHGQVPAGRELDHVCRQRDCVRVSHLEAVTHAENIQRGKTAKLTPRKVAAIRRRLERGATVGRLAGEFGVSKQAVYALRDGTAWA